jgi:hypothetical protein
MEPQMKHDDLAAIRKRLREGKLSKEDVQELERIVLSAESSIKALRAAMVE